MRFPNAYKGIKRIYLGEIMGLIATALTVVSTRPCWPPFCWR